MRWSTAVWTSSAARRRSRTGLATAQRAVSTVGRPRRSRRGPARRPSRCRKGLETEPHRGRDRGRRPIGLRGTPEPRRASRSCQRADAASGSAAVIRRRLDPACPTNRLLVLAATSGRVCSRRGAGRATAWARAMPIVPGHGRDGLTLIARRNGHGLGPCCVSHGSRPARWQWVGAAAVSHPRLDRLAPPAGRSSGTVYDA